MNTVPRARAWRQAIWEITGDANTLAGLFFDQIEPSFLWQIMRHCKTVTPDGCWEWAGSLGGGRLPYGRVHLGGQSFRVHRLTYEIVHGVTLPIEVMVCHSCDYPSCFYPGHLFLGDALANSRDMVAKGRQNKGEKNGNANLTIEIVQQMRQMFSSGVPIREIALTTGSTYGNVWLIVNEKAWKP